MQDLKKINGFVLNPKRFALPFIGKIFMEGSSFALEEKTHQALLLLSTEKRVLLTIK